VAAADLLRLRPVRPWACTGFELARQRMLRELADWITEVGPADDLIAMEAHATASAVVQMAEMLAGRPK
jgi:hypothetical protein